MRDIESIEQPVWQDLLDRESEMRKLKQEVEELRATVREQERIMSDLRVRLERKIALLGVP